MIQGFSSNRIITTLTLFILVTVPRLPGSPVRAQESGQFRLMPALPYQAEVKDRKTYEVDFAAVVTAPYGTSVLKVWMPIPPSDNVQQIAASEFSTFPMERDPQIKTEPVYGNRFACFEFHHPRGAQIIRHRFIATVANLYWNIDADRIERPSKWPGAFEPWLKSPSIAKSEDFRVVVQQFAANQETNANSLFKAMSWIDQNLKYEHAKASLQADAAHAFITRQGHCSDYHGLCCAFGRNLGFPTRVTYGLSLYPKNSPSHCKLEAYLPPYGWVSFDLSETQKLVSRINADESLSKIEKTKLTAAATRRLMTGFRENCWLLCTTGTNYELAPRASRPVAVVRTIYAEADGVALPEPDPANVNQREFSWMTVHEYQTDGAVVKPFEDFSTLQSR